jgi:transposase-like protein
MVDELLDTRPRHPDRRDRWAEGLSGSDRVGVRKTQIQLCIVHRVRNSLRYVSWNHRKAVRGTSARSTAAPTLEAAEAALESFSQTWDEITPLSAGSGEATVQT